MSIKHDGSKRFEGLKYDQKDRQKIDFRVDYELK